MPTRMSDTDGKTTCRSASRDRMAGQAELVKVRDAIAGLCGMDSVDAFEEEDFQLLWKNKYRTLDVLSAAKRQSLEKINLPYGLIDVIEKAQERRAAAAEAGAVVQQQERQEPARRPRVMLTLTLKHKGDECTQAYLDIPSWSAVCERVEECFKKFQTEDFQLRAGKVVVDARNWPQQAGLAASKRPPALVLGVVSLTKGFSQYRKPEAFDLLGLERPHTESCGDDDFGLADFDVSKRLPDKMAEYTGLKTAQDVLEFAGKELSIRCWQFAPIGSTKEASRRELVSPVLYAGAMLSGDITIMAELAMTGTVAWGSIDYVMLYKNYSVVIVEAKREDTLDQHLGQLAAEIRTARETFCMSYLGKRKHDVDDIKQVPSFGILTNGIAYRLYKFDPAKRALLESEELRPALAINITASAATRIVTPLIRYLVHMLEDQKRCLDAATLAYQRKRSRAGEEEGSGS